MKKKIVLGCFVLFYVIQFFSFPVLGQVRVVKTGHPLSQEDKAAFVEKASQMLIENYVFPDVAEKVVVYLKSRLTAGAYDSINNSAVFVPFMTKEMQFVSHDRHMRVTVIPSPIAIEGESDPFLEGLLEQKEEEAGNFGFVKADILNGNIGYIDLREFAPLVRARETATAALQFVSHADAVIFDLRKNNGGQPELIQYICSYFFDQPTHLNSLYYRKANRTVEYWTLDHVDGPKMTGVPLFVLTSRRTFSGGEEFSYNMQTRKRATLIGETTGGGANPGDEFPVYQDLGLFIPMGKAVNPVTGTNWEGVGVKPDVEVSADKAMDVALEKASAEAEQYHKAKMDQTIRIFKDVKDRLAQAELLTGQQKQAEAVNVLLDGLDLGIRNGSLNESFINDLGYKFLGNDKMQLAIETFRFNVKTFPGSFNAYDSLGEAYLKAGDKKLAKENYKKSLDLNPANDNARKVLKDLM